MEIKAGDFIRVVTLDDGSGEEKAFENAYQIGDVLEVEYVKSRQNARDIIKTKCGCFLFKSEIEVIKKKTKDKKGEKKVKTKAKKGDIIKIVALDDGEGNPMAHNGMYEIGDHMKVKKAEKIELFGNSKEVTITKCGCHLFDHEFEVIKIKKKKKQED